MKLRRFKQWWQVVSESGGGTIAQFLSRTQALEFIALSGRYPMAENVSFQLVSQHRGYTMRRINKYP